VLKGKAEAEERVRKSLKEKDKVETIAQENQVAVQKLYKAIPEAPIVVEATMEEQVLNIGEVIKGFIEKIQDLWLRKMPRTPPKVCKGGEIMETITITNIKKIQEECTKICEESAQVWKKLIEYPEIKAIEAKLREVKEHAHQAIDMVSTLLPMECKSSILS
jgi:hypothetical protein